MTKADRQLSKSLDSFLSRSYWTAAKTAEHLRCSTTMISFLRNGKRAPGPKLRKRIEKLLAL